jgi:flagellar protein FliO/FliZ
MSPVAAYIVESLVTLVGVVLLAVVVLYGGRRLGIGRSSGPLELVGRLPLDARRAVYLVRVGKLVYVVGASEGGLTRLGEIDADSVPSAGQGALPPRFADFLAKITRPRADASPLTAPSSAPSQSEAPPAPPPADPDGHA